MTEEEKELLKRYGITVEQKSVYSYRGYKYGNLNDALNYAKADSGSEQESGTPRIRQG